MGRAGREARVFSGDGYTTGTSGSQGNPVAVGAQDEHDRREIDSFLSDWPGVGSLEDFEKDLRKFQTEQRQYESAFDTGSNYFDDQTWSPDVQLGHYDKPNSLTDPEGSATNPIVLESTVSLARQQPSRNNEALLNWLASSSSFSPSSSSSSCSWKHSPSRKRPHGASPDMVLDDMAENPLQLNFPQMMTTTTTTTAAHQQPPQNVTSAATQMLLHPQGYLAGDNVAHSSEGSSGGSCERPRWSSVLEALPVQFLAFQKLQEGMDQFDVGTRLRISDALYRLANNVEESYRLHQQLATGGSVRPSTSANSVWTQAQEVRNPMDRPLLLQNPPKRETTDNRQTNRDPSS